MDQPGNSCAVFINVLPDICSANYVSKFNNRYKMLTDFSADDSLFCSTELSTSASFSTHLFKVSTTRQNNAQYDGYIMPLHGLLKLLCMRDGSANRIRAYTIG